MTARRKLPNRRPHEILEIGWRDVPFVWGVALFEDGQLAEVFNHSAGKPGSAIEAFAADAAVAISLACQFGATIEDLRRSAQKLRDGTGAGPIGALLDILADRKATDES